MQDDFAIWESVYDTQAGPQTGQSAPDGLERSVKIVDVETFPVGAGWKNWLFVRVLTDEGLHGVGEATLNGFTRTCETAVLR